VGPEKNTFYSGAIRPHLGEIWNFEIFNITVFEPILAKSLQKTRNNTNLQISGVVQLQGFYKSAQKFGGSPPQGTGPPEKVTNVEFWHFGPTVVRPLALTLTTSGKMFTACYSVYTRL